MCVGTGVGEYFENMKEVQKEIRKCKGALNIRKCEWAILKMLKGILKGKSALKNWEFLRNTLVLS